MRAVILDTNVIVKWYGREKEREEATQILNRCMLDGIEIIVPETALQELKNTFVHRYRLNEKLIKLIVDDLQNIKVLKFSKVDDKLNLRALEIADRYNITVYDAVFVALAETMGAEFITADQELYDKVFQHFKFVKLLKEKEAGY